MKFNFQKLTIYLSIFLGIFLLSLLSYKEYLLSYYIIILIILAFSYLSYKFPKIALGLILFELIIGGHGIWLESPNDIYSISLRQSLFIGFFSGYIFGLYKKTIQFNKIKIPASFFALMLILFLSFSLGLLSNTTNLVISDFTGYLFLLYLIPIYLLKWGSQDKKFIMEILLYSGITLAIFNLSLAFIFSHLDGEILDFWYKFLRDRRIAEITLIITNGDGIFSQIMNLFLGDKPYFYRVFLVSQLYLIPLFFYLTFDFLKSNYKIFSFSSLLLIITLSSLLTSMSRSFAVGSLFSLCIFFIWFIVTNKKLKLALYRSSQYLVLFIFSIILAILIPSFQLGKPDLTQAIFYETSAETGREAAIISRVDLLREVNDEIIKAPIIGYGFGKEITYQSADKRILDIYGTNEYTTHRFEWGYHDFILKFGLLGLLIWIWFIADLMRLLNFQKISYEQKKWQIAIIFSTISLLIIHIFTPFINHPLGLGFLLIIAIFTQIELIKQRNILIFPTINDFRSK